jgi:hypothetical protein
MTTEQWQGWTLGCLGNLGYALEIFLGAFTLTMGAASEERPISETNSSGEGSDNRDIGSKSSFLFLR